jgi:hypothetical protein
MLLTYLGRAIFWVLRLFLPRSILPAPPKAKKPTKFKPIDTRKAMCPACYVVGSITVEHVTVSTHPGKSDAIRANAMLFSCGACKAFWYRKPQYAEVIVGGMAVAPDMIHGREVRGITA